MESRAVFVCPSLRESLASLTGWPDTVFVPLGYTPAPEGGAIVPVYPAGLPLLMALFTVCGWARRAAYYVVPLLGLLSVLLTYWCGRLVGGRSTAALAAAAWAANPVLLCQLMQPMSDVPAATWANRRHHAGLERQGGARMARGRRARVRADLDPTQPGSARRHVRGRALPEVGAHVGTPPGLRPGAPPASCPGWSS